MQVSSRVQVCTQITKSSHDFLKNIIVYVVICDRCYYFYTLKELKQILRLGTSLINVEAFCCFRFTDD